MPDIFQRDDSVRLALDEGQAALDALRKDCPAPRRETIQNTAVKFRILALQLSKLADATPAQPPSMHHA